MKKEIGKIVLVQERISEKRVLTFEKKSEKGPRSNTKKKLIQDQQSEKLGQTKILEIWTQEQLVLIFLRILHTVSAFSRKISTALLKLIKTT